MTYGDQAQAEMDFDLYMAWLKSMKKITDGYRFDDGSIINTTETFNVHIGNVEDHFESLIEAANHLWSNHASYNVLG